MEEKDEKFRKESEERAGELRIMHEQTRAEFAAVMDVLLALVKDVKALNKMSRRVRTVEERTGLVEGAVQSHVSNKALHLA